MPKPAKATKTASVSLYESPAPELLKVGPCPSGGVTNAHHLWDAPPPPPPPTTPRHPTNGLRGLPSRIWVWGWGHWAPRTWVSRTDLPTSRTATDRNCSDGVERRSRPPNPARWAPKREGLATTTAQTASKDTPSRHIEVTGPQSEKGKRPQLLRWRRKTLPLTKSSSLDPKA